VNDKRFILDTEDKDFDVVESVIRTFETVPKFLAVTKELRGGYIEGGAVMKAVDALFDHSKTLPISKGVPSVTARDRFSIQDLESDTEITVRIEVTVTIEPYIFDDEVQ
jgi:hypothetical protein